MRKTFKVLLLVGGGITIIVLVLVVNYFTMAWTEPTSPPPAGSGSLTSGKWSDSAAAPGDIYYNGGNVGIGTNIPSQSLDVNGYVKGQSGLCIGNDCKSSWPGSGSINVYECPRAVNASGCVDICRPYLSTMSACRDYFPACTLRACTYKGKILN